MPKTDNVIDFANFRKRATPESKPFPDEVSLNKEFFVTEMAMRVNDMAKLYGMAMAMMIYSKKKRPNDDWSDSELKLNGLRKDLTDVIEALIHLEEE